MRHKHTSGIICISLLGLVVTEPALAYIDPGSGSYLFQILAAGAIGAAYSLRLYWDRVKLFVAGIVSKKSDNP